MNRFLKSSSRKSTRKLVRNTRSHSLGKRFSLLELLEARTLMSASPIWVTSANDDGTGSLRQAILQANATAGHDTIEFNIASGAQAIHLISALPAITDELTLDATTQSGYTGAPLIWIDGSQLGSAADGLSVTAGSSTIKGLAISGFVYGAGINISGADGNTLQGNFIGLDPTASFPASNNQNNRVGIILASPGNTLDGNVISRNSTTGVSVLGLNNQILNNIIGADPTGTLAMGNGVDGIAVGSNFDPSLASATISGNLISGNFVRGISFTGHYTTSSITNNRIGVDSTGTLPMGNSASGIYIGPNATASTLAISGNLVASSGADGIYLLDASNVTITGNTIGTNAVGSALLGNSGNGFLLDGVSSNITIGGANSSARNVISGNSGDGLRIQTVGGSGITVQGNYIGTNPSGIAAIANQGNGISVLDSNMQILNNLLSGNAGYGLQLGNIIYLADSNTVQGNLIGTQADGLSPLGNESDGISIDGSNNTLSANTIAFNGGAYGGNGISVNSGTGNAIRQNSIHHNASGDPALLGIGIDLGYDGVTLNDSIGHDGANLLQNFPVITNASRSGSSVSISGTLNAAPDSTFTLDFFSSTVADPSGYGQGETYLGSVTVVTDSTGLAQFQTTLNASAAHSVITATATDSANNTSEFSLAAAIQNSQPTTLNTSTALASSANPSFFGQSVLFTATVSDQFGAIVTAGLVDFFDGTTLLGTGTLDTFGNATFTTSTLTVGSHSFTAVYDGSGLLLASTSASLNQSVNQGQTSTTLQSSASTTTLGQSVTFTASVAIAAPAAGTLSGSVSFFDGNTLLGTSTLDATGQATLTTSSLSVGNHAITAVYSGDTNFATSTSAPLAQAVNPLLSNLSGYVYLDQNNDGIRQSTEFGIANVQVTLSGTDDLGNITPIVVTTNASGYYSFQNIRPGTYSISEQSQIQAPLNAYISGKNAIGAQGGTVTGDVFSNITIPGGTTGAENDFAELKNVVAGRVLRDMTGNGMSADDTPLAGVTVKLYSEKGTNSTLDSGDGSAIATVVTDANGNYSFINLAPGRYYTKESTPSGYIRTIPTNSDNYGINVTGGFQGTSFDFDNYKLCTWTVTNVSFTINGKTVVTDLRGKTHQGDTVTVKFTMVDPGYVTLVSYDAPTASFDANNASQQTIYQQSGGFFQPGTHTLTVTNPTNYYQIDFVKCKPIDTFGPAGSNIFYSAQSRLISADNAGLHSDVDGEAAATTFWAHLGQSLITSFNVTDTNESPTVLANWLASSFPNLYGASGANNLTDKTNADVAAFFLKLYNSSSKTTDAQVLATALNVYASTQSLGGDAATHYGFSVSTAGLGSATFNVQSNGAAFGVANNSTLSVWQLLTATNSKSRNDILYSGTASFLAQAYNVYSTINNSGGIA